MEETDIFQREGGGGGKRLTKEHRCIAYIQKQCSEGLESGWQGDGEVMRKNRGHL